METYKTSWPYLSNFYSLLQDIMKSILPKWIVNTELTYNKNQTKFIANIV